MNRRDRRQADKQLKKEKRLGDKTMATGLGVAGPQPDQKKLMKPAAVIPSDRPVMYADFLGMSGEHGGGVRLDFSKVYPEQNVNKEQASIVVPGALATYMVDMLCTMYQYFPTKEQVAENMRKSVMTQKLDRGNPE